jgi:hypothetical protein
MGKICVYVGPRTSVRVWVRVKFRVSPKVIVSVTPRSRVNVRGMVCDRIRAKSLLKFWVNVIVSVRHWSRVRFIVRFNYR